MSEEEIEPADEEIQNIFLNPFGESSEHHIAIDRPSAPEPLQLPNTQNSSGSDISDPSQVAIFHRPASGSIPSNWLCFSLSDSSESRSAPLTGASNQYERDFETLVSSGATRTDSSLIQDTTEGRLHRECSSSSREARVDEIIPHLQQACLCRSCIDTLLHSGLNKSYFVKKFRESCSLCEFKCLMKDYQKICNECSRRKNLCLKCVSCAVFTDKESILDFEPMLKGELGEIFSTLCEGIQHSIIKQVYRAFDMSDTASKPKETALRVFKYMIQKYKQ